MSTEARDLPGEPEESPEVLEIKSSDVKTIGDLPEKISGSPKLEEIADVEIPEPIKDPVTREDLRHRQFDDTEFWRRIPRFEDVSFEEFIDFKFQNRNSVTSAKQLDEFLEGLVETEFLEDVREGMALAPMNMRLSPYILSRVDWSNPYDDPIRIQFVPVASSRLPDHPRLQLDSLHERQDSPVPGIVHRYTDKALFLPLDVCPVYCRFCTRSYAIGGNTDSVEKFRYTPNQDRWNEVFAYIASRPEIEDIVVSGGDAFMLAPPHLKHIGETLLQIPHIRRIRLASKGPAVMPMKILTDHKWTDTLVELVEFGRKLHKEVCLHTHFNSTHEISEITRQAMNLLFERGVKVRNQSVMIAGVNDDADETVQLVRQLSYMNVQPYYVYQHDMVKGVEDLRTAVRDTIEIERAVRGATAGFNTPVFVNDVPGGGGKRDVHSFDHYDPVTGVSVYRSPAVDDAKVYLYFDPIHRLPEEGRQRWADPAEQRKIVDEAVRDAGLEDMERATE
ncbi:MAG: KamA family radical SAM protein [Thermoanaerobaculia bacterium]|nr:KamA family radical SAM protein [Thermoanaerobaculia bacterium]